MTNEKKISVKLQLEKNESSGDMMITVRFNPEASNYIKDKTGYSWYPTSAEIEFLNEAFDLIPEYKSSGNHFVNKKPEKTTTPIPETTPSTEKIEPEPTKEKDAEEPLQRIPPPPPEPKEEKETDKKLDEGSFDPIDEENKNQDLPDLEEPKNEEDILVDADSKTIDDIVNKREGYEEDDGLMVEADEKTIIDKVLKQKKKGKWARK